MPLIIRMATDPQWSEITDVLVRGAPYRLYRLHRSSGPGQRPELIVSCRRELRSKCPLA